MTAGLELTLELLGVPVRIRCSHPEAAARLAVCYARSGRPVTANGGAIGAELEEQAGSWTARVSGREAVGGARTRRSRAGSAPRAHARGDAARARAVLRPCRGRGARRPSSGLAGVVPGWQVDVGPGVLVCRSAIALRRAPRLRSEIRLRAAVPARDQGPRSMLAVLPAARSQLRRSGRGTVPSVRRPSAPMPSPARLP